MADLNTLIDDTAWLADFTSAADTLATAVAAPKLGKILEDLDTPLTDSLHDSLAHAAEEVLKPLQESVRAFTDAALDQAAAPLREMARREADKMTSTFEALAPHLTPTRPTAPDALAGSSLLRLHKQLERDWDDRLAPLLRSVIRPPTDAPAGDHDDLLSYDVVHRPTSPVDPENDRLDVVDLLKQVEPAVTAAVGILFLAWLSADEEVADIIATYLEILGAMWLVAHRAWKAGRPSDDS